MSVRQTGSRLTYGASRYALESDAVVYRNGASATNLLMRVWTDSKATSATGAVTFTIPAATFTTVQFIELTVMRDTADPQFATFCMLRSFTTTTVVAQCFESKQTGVLLGGVIEGLELATSSLIAMVKVTGV